MNTTMSTKADISLIDAVFSEKRIQETIDKCREKGINKKDVLEFCKPEFLEAMYQAIKRGKYRIFPPRVAKIPKDNGDFREVYVNMPRDRFLLTLVNDTLCDKFSHMIHPQCTSYQKGKGTQETVSKISGEIKEFYDMGIKQIGYKSDFSKYFDTVKIGVIDSVFDDIERQLGVDNDPIIAVLREYYHQDTYFDEDLNVREKYQSLKQGCAVASFLANVCLYSLDEFMSQKYQIYYRYSDDIVVIDPKYDSIIDDINEHIKPFGMVLNPKKVEPLYSDKWFKFLGFNLRADKITLSKNRLKRFQKEIESRSIKKKSTTAKKARNEIIQYLFVGDYCWAHSCLGIINVEADLNEMNKFIMDCIRACETGKKKIGGLGSDMVSYPYKTVVRGKGKHVKSNRIKTDKTIKGFLSLKCLSDNYKYNRALFDALVADLILVG